MPTNVVMPQLGESVVEGTVGKWFKQVGDKVEQYEPIMEVVTDKVTTEIPSPAAGTLTQILVPDGQTVQAGTVLAVIGGAGESAPPAAPLPQVAAPQAAPSPVSPAPSPVAAPAAPEAEPVKVTAAGAPEMRLTPVVARMISENHLTSADLQRICGTGEGGRISKKDLEHYLESRGQTSAPQAEPELAPWEQPGTGELFRPTEEIFGTSGTPPVRESPAPPAAVARPAVPPPSPAAPPASAAKPAAPGPREELVPLTVLRKSIAERMVRSKQTAPHVTSVHEADFSRVIAHQQKHQEEFQRQGAKLTYTAYLVEAAVAALRAVPLVNASFTDQGVLLKHYINIGLAVAIPDGLIVPVVKNADEKNLLGLARAVNDLSQRARDKRLAPEDVQGGTFTITNYGVFGSLFGTPIINQPQSAILGVGAVQKRVVVIDDAIAIRPMVYLGLTFDHRLLDGATGDRFMNELKKYLANYPE